MILFPPEGTDPGALGDQVAALRRSAERAGAAAPLVAIDQEGGEVERLPACRRIVRRPRSRSRASAPRAPRAAPPARALAALGIDVDLAPVLDVPASTARSSPRARTRPIPAQVATLGTAFGDGLAAARASRRRRSTSPASGWRPRTPTWRRAPIDASRAELDAGLEPFGAAIEAGFELVMVANATYPAFDAGAPGLAVAARDRGAAARAARLRGVVITDDLGAGALTGAGLDEGEAAVGAARAGADLLLFALSDGAVAREAL